MQKFIFAYHGGSKPQTQEEGEARMAEWRSWMDANQAAFADPGAPVGKSHTVSSSGTVDNGGPNPLSGYTIVLAADLDAALALASDCPAVAHGGSIEVAPIVDIDM